MQQNIKTPMFLDQPVVEQDIGDKEEETDTNVNMQTIMEESLSRVAEVSSANSNRSVSALQGLARQR
jgi:hypothetical protein